MANPKLWNKVKSSDQYHKWKLAVRKKCNYKCQSCGLLKKTNRKVRFDCHHIKPKALFVRSIFSLNNGVLLCQACHIEAHKVMLVEFPHYSTKKTASDAYLNKLIARLTFKKLTTRRRGNNKKKRRKL